MCESLHPFFGRSEYSGLVRFKGAKALRITFDPRTSLDKKSTLSFFGDGESLVAKFSSSDEKGEYKPFIVHGDAIKFRFEASIGDIITKHWGYRFHVSPLRGLQWTAETQVLKDPSLQWACWVLGFLLRSIDSFQGKGAVHNRSVHDALLSYLVSSGSPYKHRVVVLLIQLMQSPNLFSELPDMKRLFSISDRVMERVKRDKTNGVLFLPSGLLDLIELAVTSLDACRDEELKMKAHPLLVTLSDVRHYCKILSGATKKFPKRLETESWNLGLGQVELVESLHPLRMSSCVCLSLTTYPLSPVLPPLTASTLVEYGCMCTLRGTATLEFDKRSELRPKDVLVIVELGDDDDDEIRHTFVGNFGKDIKKSLKLTSKRVIVELKRSYDEDVKEEEKEEEEEEEKEKEKEVWGFAFTLAYEKAEDMANDDEDGFWMDGGWMMDAKWPEIDASIVRSFFFSLSIYFFSVQSFSVHFFSTL